VTVIVSDGRSTGGRSMKISACSQLKWATSTTSADIRGASVSPGRGFGANGQNVKARKAVRAIRAMSIANHLTPAVRGVNRLRFRRHVWIVQKNRHQTPCNARAVPQVVGGAHRLLARLIDHPVVGPLAAQAKVLPLCLKT
jgi:hypothetical protein